MATKEMEVTKINLENTENEVDTGAAASSKEVSVSRKRKSKGEKMETDVSAKKPNFPPVAIDEGVVNLFLIFFFTKDLLSIC